MARAEAARLRWRIGTPLGLLVVPLVCSSSATASGSRGGAEPAAAMPPSASSAVRGARELDLPHAERCAGGARRALLAAQEEHRARLQVLEIGAELVARVGLVERRGGRAGGDDAEERRDDLGPVRQAHRDGVARPDAGRRERAGEPVGDRAQLAVGRALAARGLDERERAVGRRRAGRAAPVAPVTRAIPCRRRQLPASTSRADRDRLRRRQPAVLDGARRARARAPRARRAPRTTRPRARSPRPSRRAPCEGGATPSAVSISRSIASDAHGMPIERSR